MVTVSNFLSLFSLSELKKLLLTLFFFYYFYEDIDMNTFEQLITTLGKFEINKNNNNWDEKCHALKVLLENTKINEYTRHKRETDCLLDTLYIWKNANDNDPQVILKTSNSTVWDVTVILDNQIVKVIGLRPL